MLGAGTRNIRRWLDVERIGALFDGHVEEGIRTTQAPELGGAPVGIDFTSNGSTHETVAKFGGKQLVRGRGRVLDVGRAGDVFAEEIVVLVEKSCEVDIDIAADEAAIAEFVSVKFFGFKIRIGVETGEKRQAVGLVSANIAGEKEVAFAVGGRAQGAGNCQPEGLRGGGCP